MDTLTIKNYQINTLITALNYTMPFSKGRVRNRFITILSTKAQEVEKNRMEILNGVCEKGEDGKPIVDKNEYKLTDEARKKFGEEYAKLMNENCIIDVTASLKMDLGPIKDMINNSKSELNIDQTKVVEDVLAAFEVTKPKAVAKKK